MVKIIEKFNKFIKKLIYKCNDLIYFFIQVINIFFFLNLHNIRAPPK